jgi:hypothetical protein
MYKQDLMFTGGVSKSAAECIKQASLISKIEPEYKFEKKSSFKPEILMENMDVVAPKIKAMLDKIKELDEKDMRRDKHLFKHVVYVDFKGAYAKIVASALIAGGFHMAFDQTFKIDENKLVTGSRKSKNFGFLCGSTMYEKTFPVKFKKIVNALFNRRPDNVYGEYMRIMLYDSAHREGIDLYDVKYVHILQDPQTEADRRQAIGRSTRLCGQKGLVFQPNKGWTLQVFIYDQTLPENMQTEDIETINDLYLSASNIDLGLIKFAPELDKMIEYVAVDKELTENIHTISFKESNSSKSKSKSVDMEDILPSQTAHDGGAKKKKGPIMRPKPPTTKKTLAAMSEYVMQRFDKYKWPPAELSNMCGYAGPGSDETDGGASIVELSPTQNFVRLYFQPSSAYKGMLAIHSVGTGKSCLAISTATTSWEPQGYTILYVTRTSLKTDIYKNMFQQVCSLVLKQDMKHGLELPPNAINKPRTYLSDRWVLPISFKQFSNICEGKNKFYHDMVKRNGKQDPLRKTFVIIDEAHKLNAHDVIGAEKPNTPAIEEAIQRSYMVSGDDSVRVLLMTGTPYTSNPMDLIRLTNLLRPTDEAIPTNFDEFKREFLNTNGKFSDTGSKIFANKMSGYISYLNRSNDARQFTIPAIETIQVPLSATTQPDKDTIKKDIAAIKTRTDAIKEEIKTVKQTLAQRTEAECGTIPVKKRKPCKDNIKTQQEGELNRVVSTLEQNLEVSKGRMNDLKSQLKTAKENKDKNIAQLQALQSKCKTKQHKTQRVVLT